MSVPAADAGDARDPTLGRRDGDGLEFEGPTPLRVLDGDERVGHRVLAQLRAHGGTAAGSVDLVDGRLRLSLDEPVRGVAPGQTVVLYDPAGDFVIGAGTVVRTGG